MEGSTCDEGASADQDSGLFGPPVYDPSQEPDVTAHSQVALSFAIEEVVEATPV